MYNGIGLQTVRGSGANGYVQQNKFSVRLKTTNSSAADQGTADFIRKPNQQVWSMTDRKRQIELKLLELEEKLTDQGYTADEISQKLREARENLEGDNATAVLEKKENFNGKLYEERINP